MRNTGSYERLGNIEYFVPAFLPPHDPPLNMSTEIIDAYGQAMLALGKLNEMADRVPDIKRFIKAYVMKEALLSSEIEGIYTTFLDVFTTPLTENKPNKETQLVLNYMLALDGALELVQKQGLPIVSKVILEAHKLLLSNGEGDRANPGYYRQQAVRVGKLIPPPSHKIPDLISNLEKYINDDNSLLPLIKAGLVHVQFETIHPFLDGNGRIGRLLIVLMLIESGLLNFPILYPSYYFKKNQLEYYQSLDRVRTHGDFEGWILFYLEGIKLSSLDAHKRISKIELLEKELKEIISNDKRPKMRDSYLQALSILFQSPIIRIPEFSELIKKSYSTTKSLVAHFVELNILEEIKDKKRNKMWRFSAYLNLLEEDL